MFGLTLCLFPYSMCANSEGFGETTQMRRVTWAFPGCLCDKYHNLMSWLICFLISLLPKDTLEPSYLYSINTTTNIFRHSDLISCMIPEQVEEYKKKLDEVIIKTEDGTPMLPEMYTVPRDKVGEIGRNLCKWKILSIRFMKRRHLFRFNNINFLSKLLALDFLVLDLVKLLFDNRSCKWM